MCRDDQAMTHRFAAEQHPGCILKGSASKNNDVIMTDLPKKNPPIFVLYRLTVYHKDLQVLSSRRGTLELRLHWFYLVTLTFDL